MAMLILWDMTLLGVEILATPWGGISILLLGTVFWALGRWIGIAATLRIGLIGGAATGFGVLALAGTNAWFASQTIYAMPIFLAVLAGLGVGCLARLLMRRSEP